MSNSKKRAESKESKHLDLLFNGEFSIERIDYDFTNIVPRVLLEEADKTYREIRRYVVDNARFWSSITPDDKLHKEKRACSVCYEFQIKERQQDGLTLISRDIDEKNSSAKYEYHTMLMVNAAGQYIDILTSYSVLVTDSSADDIYRVLSDITDNNKKIIWGKLMYNAQRKRISHLARLSYADTYSIRLLLDEHIPKIIAEAVILLDRIEKVIPLRKMTIEDFYEGNPQFRPKTD